MKTGHLPNKNGFTLIEALAASIILAISLFAVGIAMYTQFFFINQTREGAIATLCAQEEIESIRGMPFDNILALGPSFTASGFEYLRQPSGILSINTMYGSNDICKVSVKVGWSTVMGQALEKNLATIVTRSGIDKQ